MTVPLLHALVFSCHIHMEITFLLQLATVSAFQVNKYNSLQGADGGGKRIQVKSHGWFWLPSHLPRVPSPSYLAALSFV